MVEPVSVGAVVAALVAKSVDQAGDQAVASGASGAKGDQSGLLYLLMLLLSRRERQEFLAARAVRRRRTRVGDEAGLGRLVDWLRGNLTGDRVSVMEKAVEEYDSPLRLRAFAEVVDAQVVEDPDGFGRQLQQRIDALEGAGVNVGAVTQSVWGSSNAQVAQGNTMLLFPGPPSKNKTVPLAKEVGLPVLPQLPVPQSSSQDRTSALIVDRLLPPRRGLVEEAIDREFEAYRQALSGQFQLEAERLRRTREILHTYLDELSQAVLADFPSDEEADPALNRIGPAMRQELLEVLPERAAEVWLTSPTSMLDGAAPLDVLLGEPSRSGEVLAALDAFAAGVF